MAPDKIGTGFAMLPLSRPLFDQQAASHMTLAVACALLAATLIVVATLTTGLS